jgi:hypothetical protein
VVHAPDLVATHDMGSVETDRTADVLGDQLVVSVNGRYGRATTMASVTTVCLPKGSTRISWTTSGALRADDSRS